jgi:hypothetical protein
MRGKIVFASLFLGLTGFAASAQDAANTNPFPNDVYCSGIVTTESVPKDTYVITGPESNVRITFDSGEFVYINKGAGQGVKVGDEFSIVRPVTDTIKIDWTKAQSSILKKMGTVWEDEARAKVVRVQGDVSIAQLEHACNYVQRGDIALPFMERPVPPLKPQANFDPFMPADGKALAMVITGANFQQQVGKNDIVYVNLGASQGVKVGDYFRVFRYTGTQRETAYEEKRTPFDASEGLSPTYGFGSVPKKWDWSNTPREDVGEGVVLRTGPNSATVLITFCGREIFPGDYVELE